MQELKIYLSLLFLFILWCLRRTEPRWYWFCHQVL